VRIWQDTGAPYALHMEVEARSLDQLNGLLARLRAGMGPQAAQILEQAMARAAEHLRTVAFDQTPVGATAHLRDTIGAQVSVNSQEPVDVSGYVWWQAGYAPVVEFGSRPHWPPVGPLIHWAERKLHVPPGESYGVARRIQFAIARRGTRAQEFAQRSLLLAQPLIERAFREAADRLARLMSGGV